MKFIHTADLHLGRVLNNIDLTEDQRETLFELADIAVREKADAVLIAGDVYQKAQPSAAAMTLFSDFLLRLNENGVRAVVIPGNHDSGERVAYLAPFMERGGVYVCGPFRGTLEKTVFHDAEGDVNVYMLPFLRPGEVRAHCAGADVKDYTDAVRTVLERAGIDFAERNVILAHQYVTGAVLCDSEEHVIGGLDNVDGSVFEGFDYVALGHLHTPQRVGKDTVRYSGSLIKNALAEKDHHKSVVVIELGKKGEVTLRTEPLHQRRDVREVRGSLGELLDMAPSMDLVRAVVTDENVPPDARVSLSAVFPNMIAFAVENSKTNEERSVDAGETLREQTVEELFTDFYAMQNNGELPDEEHLKVLRDVLGTIEEGGIKE